MEALQIAHTLKEFIVTQILDEDEVANLEVSTPLFELKILDSLAVVTVVNFIASEFNVQVPLENLTSDNLRSLESMGHMVKTLAAAAA